MIKILRKWIPYVICLTMTAGTLFVVLQQSLRLEGDNPQTQMAEDIAYNLDNGLLISQYITHDNIDISRSLDTFVIIYGNDNNKISSNANIHGQEPMIPVGVLEYAKENGQNKVTWQPETGVRIATVVNKYNNGTVLVGRSLREIEDRVEYIGILIGLSYGLGLLSTFTWLYIIEKKRN
ncbi:MAG: hypothetical protein UR49_C0022G0010 [candidate division WS6 bacterium GW2011_GWF2_33_92]|nr:MAG: hypothetical protein UR49_C0022G0010 [candidate division WS6 bacterium GW2011_GWF2_33_92]